MWRVWCLCIKLFFPVSSIYYGSLLKFLIHKPVKILILRNIVFVLCSLHHWCSQGLLFLFLCTHHSLPSSPMLTLTWVETTGANNHQGVVVVMPPSNLGSSLLNIPALILGEPTLSCKFEEKGKKTKKLTICTVVFISI